jgi:hypothetical protein
MSEYQYYEFVAIDRPLDGHEQAEVRALSTRARITATSFVNEYHWGDFSGDPDMLMEHYYDAHLYVANWGTHRLMFRLPSGVLGPDVVEQYCSDGLLTARTTPGSVVLTVTSEDDSGDFDLVDDPETMLPAIIGVRAEMVAGDLRPLYIAWLGARTAWEDDDYTPDLEDEDDDLEPPVPPGLDFLTAAQQALAEFLRIDDALLDVAARTSVPRDEITDEPQPVATWVAGLPTPEKDRLLARVIQGDGPQVQAELQRRLRSDTPSKTPESPRRRVVDLFDDAERHRAEQWRQATARRAETEARQEASRAAARERRLDELVRAGDTAWSRVEEMIATRKPRDYDSAVALLVELQALAQRDGHFDAFTLRTIEIRRVHARKPSLIERLDRARL